jgi:crotonobetainyl-CoA:carnitine CoA-transferase CaiB-like acyl-CoA transferase
LGGVKVLEMGTFVFAPAAAAVLSEWGADVVKIEHPRVGDPARNTSGWGVPTHVDGVGFIFEFNNRGKRSVALDAAHPEGREVFLRLVDNADVFLTNFLPVTRRKLGIDIDDVLARNPAVVYALASGQGHRGPQAEMGGFDAMTYWARSGAAIGVSPPEHPFPLAMPGPGFGDVQAGMALAGGVAAALYQRAQTGRGSVVDVSLLAAGMWAMGLTLMASSLTGSETLEHQYHAAPPNPLVNTYRTSDGGYISVVFLQPDRYWPEFCVLVGKDEWLADERFMDVPSRRTHSHALVALLDELFATRTFNQWCDILAQQEGQWDIVNSPGRALADPDAIANGYLQVVEHGGQATLTSVAAPVQFDRQVAIIKRAPTLGAHTDAVLAEIGLDTTAIAALRSGGAIG